VLSAELPGFAAVQGGLLKGSVAAPARLVSERDGPIAEIEEVDLGESSHLGRVRAVGRGGSDQVAFIGVEVEAGHVAGLELGAGGLISQHGIESV
jgi:hypothetical protein